jgi:hypothetical protein
VEVNKPMAATQHIAIFPPRRMPKVEDVSVAEADGMEAIKNYQIAPFIWRINNLSLNCELNHSPKTGSPIACKFERSSIIHDLAVSPVGPTCATTASGSGLF